MAPITVGSVVYSKAGRDKGNYFMVLEILDDSYVNVVDGKIRKLDRPKRKKIKHLKNTNDVLEAIAVKVIKGTKIFDAEVFSALRKYNQ